MRARRLLRCGLDDDCPQRPDDPAPPAHSNHSAEPFLKGMHTLARGCQAKCWLPRVRAPNGASFL